LERFLVCAAFIERFLEAQTGGQKPRNQAGALTIQIAKI
jgi:hypothetical protein